MTTPTPPQRGLPPRIYVPILIAIAAVFLFVMFVLLRIGFGVTGSAFGTDAGQKSAPQSEGPRSTK